MHVTAIVLIEAEPSAISELGPQLAEIDGIAEAHSVAGSDVDFVAIVRVADHETIAQVVTGSISKLAGVTQTNTMIAFRTFGPAIDSAAYEGFGD